MAIEVVVGKNQLTGMITGGLSVTHINYWKLYKNSVLVETSEEQTSSITFPISETADYYISASYVYNRISYETRYRKINTGSGSSYYSEEMLYELYSSWTVDDITGQIQLGTKVVILGEYLYQYIGYYTAGGKRIKRVPSYDVYEYSQYDVESYQAEIRTPTTETATSETVHIEYQAHITAIYLYDGYEWKETTAFIYLTQWEPCSPYLYTTQWN